MKIKLTIITILCFSAGLILYNHSSAATITDLQPAEDIEYGERLRIDSAVSVSKPSYFYGGMHINGVLFANNTIVNSSTDANGRDIGVTFGDNVRIDGYLYGGPLMGYHEDNIGVKIGDNVYPGLDNRNDFGKTTHRWRNAHFAGNVTVGNLIGSNIIDEDNLNSVNNPQSNYVLSYNGNNQFEWVAMSSGSSNGNNDNNLPAGTLGQTLRYSSNGWEASSLIYNDGTDIDIGGGFGNSGLTISNTGALQMNSGLTVDESAYIGSALNVVGLSNLRGQTRIGGGYDDTGVTISDTGNIQGDGDLTIDGGGSFGSSLAVGGGYLSGGMTISSNGSILTGGQIRVHSELYANSSVDIAGETTFSGGYGDSGVTIASDGSLDTDATADFYEDTTIHNPGYLEVSQFMEADNHPGSASVVNTCDSANIGRIIYYTNTTGGYAATGTGYWGCRETAADIYSWQCLGTCT